MRMSEYFINNYLTIGQTRDNHIFDNSPDFLMETAKKNLNKPTKENGRKSCCVMVGEKENEILTRLLDMCSENFQKIMVAREYVLQLVLLKVMQGEEVFAEKYKELKALNKSLDSVMPKDMFSGYWFDKVENCGEKLGKIELNFFIDGDINKYLQEAINCYITARARYSVKLFSKNKLKTYYDLDGNVICPHDYMPVNVADFIKEDDDIFTK